MLTQSELAEWCLFTKKQRDVLACLRVGVVSDAFAREQFQPHQIRSVWFDA